MNNKPFDCDTVVFDNGVFVEDFKTNINFNHFTEEELKNAIFFPKKSNINYLNFFSEDSATLFCVTAIMKDGEMISWKNQTKCQAEYLLAIDKKMLMDENEVYINLFRQSDGKNFLLHYLKTNIK